MKEILLLSSRDDDEELCVADGWRILVDTDGGLICQKAISINKWHLISTLTLSVHVLRLTGFASCAGFERKGLDRAGTLVAGVDTVGGLFGIGIGLIEMIIALHVVRSSHWLTFAAESWRLLCTAMKPPTCPVLAGS